MFYINYYQNVDFYSPTFLSESVRKWIIFAKFVTAINGTRTVRVKIALVFAELPRRRGYHGSYYLCLVGALRLKLWHIKRWPDVGLMLGHRLRRWPNIKPTLGRRFLLTVGAVGLAQITSLDLLSCDLMALLMLALSYKVELDDGFYSERGAVCIFILRGIKLDRRGIVTCGLRSSHRW